MIQPIGDVDFYVNGGIIAFFFFQHKSLNIRIILGMRQPGYNIK
jgi:hypothetical protein